MKIKTTKEKENMEEEVMGVKVKEPEVESVEEEAAPEEVEQVEEVSTEEETPVTEEDTVDVIDPAPEGIPDDFVFPIQDFDSISETKEEVKEEKDDFVKAGTARLTDSNGTTIYRFDIYHKEYSKDNGTVEFRNIVNNFNAARPSNTKDYKDFFAIFGIIKWNFGNTVLPYDKNIMIILTQLESLINEHIVIAGIKKGKFTFRVDTVD